MEGWGREGLGWGGPLSGVSPLPGEGGCSPKHQAQARWQLASCWGGGGEAATSQAGELGGEWESWWFLPHFLGWSESGGAG